jgi:poly(3-hydroxybutyrate) depolymerase
MNQLLSQQLHEVLAGMASPSKLACEQSLRVAATTLANSPAHEVSAMRVVGVLGLDDVAELRALVAQLVQEFELDASVRIHVGSFSVRFSRPASEDA